MSTIATIPAFDNTIHKTNVWLKDIRKAMKWRDDEHDRSYRALRVVLHALRDHLTVQESSDLAAQLPLLVRGIYFEGWNPTKTPVLDRTLDGFLAQIERSFKDDIIAEPDQVARAVLKVVSDHVTAGEIADIKQSLPKPIRALWE